MSIYKYVLGSGDGLSVYRLDRKTKQTSNEDFWRSADNGNELLKAKLDMTFKLYGM